MLDEIRQQVEDEPKKIRLSQQLAQLGGKVEHSQEHAFFREATDCYRVGAFRATIVMIWILVIHHLEDFVFGAPMALADFNHALAKNPDIKVRHCEARGLFRSL